MKAQDKYEVNPKAESVCSSVANGALIICIILAVICLIAFFAVIGDSTEGGLTLLGYGIVILIIGIVIWAQLKLLVNISRSLYNINDAIRTRPAIAVSEKEKADKQVGQKGGAKFSVGQLVIIKEDESQFRIDSVEDGEEMLYYSDKFGRYFTEEEIEDFQKYWKEKK